MKPWLKLGSVVATLALLAACSSGIQAPIETTLETQATGSVTKKVVASTDDAEETPALSGKIVLNGNDLELGLGDDTRPAVVGPRFTGMTIPRGAEITSVRIKFTARATSSGSASLTFHGVDQDNTSTFSTAAYNVSNRAKTSAGVAWSAPAWTQGEVGADTTTPDLRAVVQEIVNRTGWASGNALAVVVSGSGTGQRSTWAADFGSSTAPELVVNYSTTTTEPPPPSENSEIATWQSRLENQLKSANLPKAFDLKALAASGDTYDYARILNNGLTSLTAAYRVNKDPQTAGYIRDVMAIARGRLKDEHYECRIYPGDQLPKARWQCPTSEKTVQIKDGFRNLIYDNPGADATSRPFNKTDWHVMDEMLTHSGLAGAAYTLKQAGYTTDAAFWTDYLKNDFEAKWRKRNNKPTGFPFIERDLFHTYVQFARYNYYMYKLTGQSAYYSEAKRIARNTVTHVKLVSDGGYAWDHRIVEGKQSTLSDCQTTVYIRLTMQAMQDLAVMDSNLFSSTFMSKVAIAVNKRVIGSGDGKTLRNTVCGARTYTTTNAFVNYPYAAVAPWDSSGTIEKKLKAYYSSSGNTGHYNLPAMMILSLGR